MTVFYKGNVLYPTLEKYNCEPEKDQSGTKHLLLKSGIAINEMMILPEHMKHPSRAVKQGVSLVSFDIFCPS